MSQQIAAGGDFRSKEGEEPSPIIAVIVVGPHERVRKYFEVINDLITQTGFRRELCHIPADGSWTEEDTRTLLREKIQFLNDNTEVKLVGLVATNGFVFEAEKELIAQPKQWTAPNSIRVRVYPTELIVPLLADSQQPPSQRASA